LYYKYSPLLLRLFSGHPEITEEVTHKNEHFAHMLKGFVVETSKMGEVGIGLF